MDIRYGKMAKSERFDDYGLLKICFSMCASMDGKPDAVAYVWFYEHDRIPHEIDIEDHLASAIESHYKKAPN